VKILENVNEHGKSWSKLSVTKELQITVNRIAADQNKFVYDLAEEVFKETYPNYFQN
jgi:hypothetical protein